jgi:hypothetical protein
VLVVVRDSAPGLGKPGDLPVQMPIKFYLKTAKALDITIAPSLLATADGVIE